MFIENIIFFSKPKKRKHDTIESQEMITGTKVIMFPGGGIKLNKKITELLKIIKPFIIHFLDSSAMVF